MLRWNLVLKCVHEGDAFLHIFVFSVASPSQFNAWLTENGSDSDAISPDVTPQKGNALFILRSFTANNTGPVQNPTGTTGIGIIGVNRFFQGAAYDSPQEDQDFNGTTDSTGTAVWSLQLYQTVPTNWMAYAVVIELGKKGEACPLPSAKAVPTMNQWDFIFFSILLAEPAAWFIMKRIEKS